MADQDSTVVGSEQTPASAGVVETSQPDQPAEAAAPQAETVSDPFADRADPWDKAIADAGKEESDKPAEPVAEISTSDEGTKEATPTPEPAKEADKKPEGEAKSEADEILEEAFAEGEEKPKDEHVDLDKLDPKEMVDRQRNKWAKAWAERNEKWAEPVKMMRAPDVPITEVAAKLEEQHAERYAALSQHAAHKLVDENPDATFQRAYAVKMLKQNPSFDISQIPSLDDVIAQLTATQQNGNGAPAAATSSEIPSTSQDAELKALTSELDNTLSWNWRDPKLDENFIDDRERAFATSLRQMESKVRAEAQAKSEVQSKLEQQQVELEKLKGEVEGVKTTAATEQQVALKETVDTTIGDYRKSVQEKLLPHVLKSTGLEIRQDDTPEIQAFKQLRHELFTGTAYERANGLDSAFETFAFQESTVKGALEEVAKRIVDAQVKESQAKIGRNTTDAAKYHQLAEDEKIPLLQLLAQATKEFKKLRIDPDLRVLGLHSERTAKPLEEAAQRVEIAATGAGATSRQQRPEFRTADDVWDNVLTEAQREEALRAGA